VLRECSRIMEDKLRTTEEIRKNKRI